jgi:hypothetical protein
MLYAASGPSLLRVNAMKRLIILLAVLLLLLILGG